MDKDSKQWAMFIHLSVFAGYVVPMAGLVLPIVLWQMKKNDLPETDAHGKMVVNFLISFLIYGVVATVLSFVLIGIPLLIALGIAAIVYPIIGAIKANEGTLWSYPLVLHILK